MLLKYTVFQEYMVRAVVLSGVIASLIYFCLKSGFDYMLEYVQNDLLSLSFLIPTILGFFARKIATAVAGTDILISVTAKSMLWQVTVVLEIQTSKSRSSNIQNSESRFQMYDFKNL